METTEFIGIAFRSSSHMHHFVTTMLMFIGSLVLFGVAYVLPTKQPERKES